MLYRPAASTGRQWQIIRTRRTSAWRHRHACMGSLEQTHMLPRPTATAPQAQAVVHPCVGPHTSCSVARRHMHMGGPGGLWLASVLVLRLLYCAAHPLRPALPRLSHPSGPRAPAHTLAASRAGRYAACSLDGSRWPGLAMRRTQLASSASEALSGACMHAFAEGIGLWVHGPGGGRRSVTVAMRAGRLRLVAS